MGVAGNVVRHAMGSRARVLLSSAFGPYAQDDRFGSRAINPMEFYRNQVTREQGAFSLVRIAPGASRRSRRIWRLRVQYSISLRAPRLNRKLPMGGYDVVGISSIIPNAGEVQEMCRITRRQFWGGDEVDHGGAVKGGFGGQSY